MEGYPRRNARITAYGEVWAAGFHLAIWLTGNFPIGHDPTATTPMDFGADRIIELA
jgi:hypothetical protein